MPKRAFEQREAIPPNYDQTVRGLHTLGYDDPEIEVGDLVMRGWECRDADCPGKGFTFGGTIKQTCDVCAEEVEVGDEVVTPVVQVMVGGNPLRKAVAAMCRIPQERVMEGGFEGLEPAGRVHMAICSALAEALCQAASPQAIKTTGDN